jgi:hypothetical protein
VRAQSAYGVVPFHLVNIAKPGVHCQIFGRLRSASCRGAYPLRRPKSFSARATIARDDTSIDRRAAAQ